LPPIDDDTTARAPLRRGGRSPLQEIGQQPILITAVALVLVIIGIGSIFAWRAYSGSSPEPERLTAARLQQARVAQASEQIIEKTKGIEATQQQSIDQLQVLQTMQRLLTAQQNETRKLTEQVGTLTTTLDNLRQSFASTTAGDDKPAARETPRRSRSRATTNNRNRSKAAAVQRKRSR
jgi:cytoskeletal protein RodZ